ncbi:MAG: surface lipoprotein assembly modifier [Burkholderiales bacterium]
MRVSLFRAVVALAMLCIALTAAADAVTDRAKRLLEQKQAQEAFELLAPLEQQRAGDPEFDYLLGIAALDAGEPERAVFALERVLALQPDNALARAEIARAYLVLGERETARREFETVRRQPIPAEAKATIEQFLAAIAARDVTRFEGFLEAGVGVDSNVNSATGVSQIAIPVLGGIVATLNPGATRRGDTFTNLSGGFSVAHKIAQDWSVLGSAFAAWKLNSSEDQFDTRTLDANFGARWARGAEAVTVGAQLQSFELDNARFRDTRGLIAQWQHSFDERRQATVFGQYAELRYPTQSIRNADRSILGAAYAQAFSGTYTPVLYASAYVGREDELSPGVPHLGHEPFGARIGGRMTLGDGWSLFGTVSYEERRYGGPDPIFLLTRKDRQTDLAAGVSYLFRPGTTLLLQVAHTDNRSNIELNQFRRTAGTASVRFNF